MSDWYGALVSYGLNSASQERSFRMQKELQSDAQNYNTLMWNKNNAYNSPESQMQRFKSAGLNPNLIYGQMSNAAAPTISAGSAPSPAQAPPISTLETAQIGLINAQKKNIEADTDLKQSGSDLNDAKIDQIGVQNRWTEQQIENAKAELDYVKTQNDLAQQNILKVQEDIKLVAAQRGLTEEQTFAQYVDNLYAHYRNNAEIRLLKSQAGLTDAQTKEILTLLFSKKANLDAQTHLLNKQQVLAVQAIKTGKIAAENADKYGDILSFLQLVQALQGITDGLLPSVGKILR